MPTGRSAPSVRYPVPPAGATPVTYNGMLVVDKQSVALSNVAGEPYVALAPPGSGQGYLIERVDLWSSAAPTSAGLYLGTVQPQNEIDFSNSPAHDSADQAQPIYVPPGVVFSIQWGGGANSNAGSYTARVQYSVVQFVSMPFPGTG